MSIPSRFGLLVLLATLPAQKTLALSAGSLDPSFGTGGKVTTTFQTTAAAVTVNAVAVQTDGKILLAGDTQDVTTTTGRDVFLVRLEANGTLDTSFGTGGFVRTDAGSGDDRGAALGLQSDGKILLGGTWNYGGTGGTNPRFLLIRYDTNGSLDPTFGTGGIVLTDFAVGGGARAFSLAVLPGDEIVLGGDSWNLALAKYTPSGSLDPTFGTGGLAVTATSGNFNALAVQSNGMLVAAGKTFPSSGLVLARFDAAGALDPLFGTGGLVTTNVSGSSSNVVNGLVIEPGGALVVAGTTDASGSNDFLVARYTAAGSLDPSFGSGGITTTNFLGASNDVARSIVRLGDGSFVLGGSSDVNGNGDFALARYSSAGTLDPTFGGAGWVTTDLGGGAADRGSALVLQGASALVLAGFHEQQPGAGRYDWAAVRYGTTGTIDSSFGTSGIVYGPAPAASTDFLSGLALQSDGKPVVAGSSYQPLGTDPVLVRYLPNGSLDPTFGSSGFASTHFAAAIQFPTQALAVSPDDTLVVVGDTAGDFLIARFLSTGNPDPSFGTGGVVRIDLGGTQDWVHAVAVLPDGSIVAAGESNSGAPGYIGFALVKLLPSGSLDTSFGSGGIVLTHFRSGSTSERATALAVQGDGKLVAAGVANDDFGLARYLADGTLDPSFGTGGLVTTNFGGAVHDTATAVAIAPDGRIIAAGYSDVTGTQTFALTRYDASGVLDTSFGTAGRVVGPAGSAYALTLEPIGRIDVAGSRSPETGLFQIARYRTDGTPDPSFGTGGVVTTAFGGHDLTTRARAALIPSPGRLLVAGGTNTTGSDDFALAQYLTDVPSSFYVLPPCRLVDTRGPASPLGAPPLSPGQERIFPLAGSCGVPADALAISSNVTVANPTSTGSLHLSPADGSHPNTSTLNFSPGMTRANNTMLALSSDGTGSVRALSDGTTPVDVIIDVNGFFR